MRKENIIHHPNKAPDHPLLSICITAFNHESYIAKCLESVLNQETDFAYEICLGEDHSTDETRRICMEYADRNPEKIRLFLHARENVIHLNNKPSGRFNFLYNLEQAKGKYIALCDGDDYWNDPHKLQKQIDYLEDHENCSLVFSNFNRLIEKENTEVSEKEVLNEKNIKPDLSWKDILPDNYISTCTVMFRNWIKKNGVPDLMKEFPMGDWPLFLLTGQYGYLHYLTESLSTYRVHHQGIWSNIKSIYSNRNKIKTLQLLKNMKEFSNDSFYLSYNIFLIRFRILKNQIRGTLKK